MIAWNSGVFGLKNNQVKYSVVSIILRRATFIYAVQYSFLTMQRCDAFIYVVFV